MKYLIRKLCVGVLLFMGVLSGANAVYVGGNPVSFVDPLGLKPGDKFPSPNAAAIDAGSYARTYPQQGIEYGGWIYKQGKGYSYNFTKGNPGGVPREKLDNLKQQCSGSTTDLWHTHPDPGNDNPMQNNFSQGDMDTAADYQVPVYLKTPLGDTLLYNPSTQSIVKIK